MISENFNCLAITDHEIKSGNQGETERASSINNEVLSLHCGCGILKNNSIFTVV